MVWLDYDLRVVLVVVCEFFSVPALLLLCIIGDRYHEAKAAQQEVIQAHTIMVEAQDDGGYQVVE